MPALAEDLVPIAEADKAGSIAKGTEQSAKLVSDKLVSDKVQNSSIEASHYVANKPTMAAFLRKAVWPLRGIRRRFRASDHAD